jgi:hypothetical protein
VQNGKGSICVWWRSCRNCWFTTVQLTLIAIKVEMFYSIFPTVFFMSAPFILNSFVGSSPHVLHRLKKKKRISSENVDRQSKFIYTRRLLLPDRRKKTKKNKKNKASSRTDPPRGAYIFLRVLLLFLKIKINFLGWMEEERWPKRWNGRLVFQGASLS